MNPYTKSLGFTDIMSGSEDKTATVSPDQGATGETTTSSENKEAGMQTGLSEEEKDAQYKKNYAESVFGLLEEIRRQDIEAYWDIIIGIIIISLTWQKD